MGDLTDVDLFEAWHAGDSRAGSELFERYFPSLVRFFANKISGGALDDLLQQTFLAAIEARDRFRRHSKFKTFLMAIAYNTLCNYYRGRRLGPNVDCMSTSIADLGPDADLLIANKQEQRLLLSALRHIPLDYQAVLELYYWEQMPVSEIADALSLPEGTVKTRLRRARQLVDAALERLAESPDALTSTITDLEAWARSLRALKVADE